MKLALSAGALALSMALAGCGGGGSSTQNAPNTPTNPSETTQNQQTPEELRMAAEDAVKAAEMAVEALETEPDTDKITAAEMAISTARTAIARAPQADRAGFNMRLSALTEPLATAQMAVDGPSEEQVAEMDGRAAGLYEALTRSSGDNDVLGDDLDITPVRIHETREANEPNDIIITRGLSGEFELTRERANWLDDATAAPTSLGSDWAGKRLTHDIDSPAVQTITVYTNIENAKAADFAADSGSIYRAGRTTGQILHLPTATTNADAILALPVADMADAYEQGLLDPRHFPKAGAPGTRPAEHVYATTPTTGERPKSFPGTFHGASGTYTCGESDAGTDCTITVTPATNAAAPIYTSSADWTFQPDGQHNSKNDAQLVAQDADWLGFGWWQRRPNGPSIGDTKDYQYEVQVFYGGADPYLQSSIPAVGEGSARYTGQAAGLYAVKAHEDANEMAVPASHGEFTADVSLTAMFNGTTASLGGGINNFMADGTEMDWSLTLARKDIEGDNFARIEDGVLRSPGFGNGSANAGGWEASFYGSDAIRAGTRPQPTGVAGKFFANIDSNRAVAGGFGATK